MIVLVFWIILKVHCSDDMPVLKLGHCMCVVIGASGELS